MRFESSAFWTCVASFRPAKFGVRPFAVAALAFFLMAASNAFAQQAVIIQDNFSGPNGTSVANNAPDTTNLPGGTWTVPVGSPTYQSPNTLAFNAANGFMMLPTASGTYTPPTTLTVSASFSLGNITTNSDNYSRGMGLGFFASTATGNGVGEWAWAGGLSLDPAGQQVRSRAGGTRSGARRHSPEREPAGHGCV